MKFTEGAFRDWGTRSPRTSSAPRRSTAGPGASYRGIVVKTPSLTSRFNKFSPVREEFDVIATPT